MKTDDNHALKAKAQLPKVTVQIQPDLKQLQVYNRIKLVLADFLRNSLQGFKSLGRGDAEAQCSSLMVKLAEDRFTLAVLGQFKRGKSSLMNAIVGQDIIPTGVLPLTSVITKLKYGPAKKMLVNYDYSIFPDEQPVSLLQEYVTEKGNPGNAKKVKDVTLELPVSFLQKGVEFVDTPGVGSAIESNTETTYDFLPDCDAVLFVTAADAPMSTLEVAFIQKIISYVNKIFFVINKIDLLAEGERDDVTRFVTGIIHSQAGYEQARVFSISSHTALAAKMNADAGLYRQSGLRSLEETLVTFLTREKTSVLLKTVTGKLLEILDNEQKRNSFNASSVQDSTFEETKAGAPERNAAIILLKNTHHKVKKLYGDIPDGGRDDLQYDEIALSTEPPILPVNAMVKSQTDELQQTDFDVLEISDIKDIGSCPVCKHLVIESQKFYVHWQYLLATEERSQKRFAAALGFCPLHTWQLLAVSSPYGASLGYARLAEQIANRIRNGSRANPSVNPINLLLRESKNCRVCQLLQQLEKNYIEQFTELISKIDVQSRYNRSEGLCLRHLNMLLDSVSVPEVRNFLLLHEARHFEQDAEDMRRYAMKRDALRRSLLNQNEKNAYFRTVSHLVGHRSLCAPWDLDGEI